MSEGDQLEQGFDLPGYVNLILHRKWIVVGFTAVLCTLVGIGTALQPRVYQARASILVGLKAPQLLDFDPIPEEGFRGRDSGRTQQAILISRSLLQRAVKRLLEEGSYGEIPPAEVERRSFNIAGSLRASKSIQAVTIPNSRLLRIVAEGRDPDLIARLANVIAEEYVARNLEQKQQMANDAVAWLETKLSEAEGRLKQSRSELQAFKEKHEITSDEADSLSTLSVTRLNDEYMTTYLQRMQLELRLEAIKNDRSQGSAEEPPAVQSLNDEIQAQMRQRLQTEYVDGQLQMRDLSRRYGEQHPDIIALKTRQAKLERELEALDEPESGPVTKSAPELTGNLADLEVEYEGLLRKEQILARTLASQKAQTKNLPRTQVAYELLKENVELDDKTYDDFLSKLNAARLSSELKSPSVQVLERAEVPTVPIEPQPIRNMVVALLLGLALGVGLILVMENLNRDVKSPQDVAQHLKLPLLMAVPVVKGSRGAPEEEDEYDLVSLRQPRSHGAECYRNLRTSILFSSGKHVPKTILVTSAVANEGKSTTAANLAVVMAQNGQRTLLIDADLRRPSLQTFFTLKGDGGLSTLLEDEVQIEEAVQASGIENLDLLLCRGIPQNPSELLGSKRMSELMVTLKAKYDVIMIDSPIIISVPDAVILAALSEAVIMVHRPGATDREMVLKARQRLDEVKANILGLVMNSVDLKGGGYRYAQHLYYGYGTDVDRQTGRGKARKA